MKVADFIPIHKQRCVVSAIAFFVLIGTTSNFVVGFLATLSIVGIVSCTTGAMTLRGWSRGVTESVATVSIEGVDEGVVEGFAIVAVGAVEGREGGVSGARATRRHRAPTQACSKVANHGVTTNIAVHTCTGTHKNVVWMSRD